MRLGSAVSIVGRVLGRRPADLLPLYVLGTALVALVQVGALLGLAAIGLYLAATGRLAEIRTGLEDLDTPPNPETAPEAFAEWADGFDAALEPALTIPVGLLIAITTLVTVAVLVVATAAVSAGQLAGCLGRLRSERGLTAGLAGLRRHWLSFLGLYALELGLYVALTVGAALLGGLGSVLFAAGSIAAVVGAGAVLVAVLGWLVGALLVRATFAFAPVAVVVDDVGAVRGTRYAASYLRHRPIEAGFYYLLVIAALVGFGLFTSVLGVVGIAAGTGLAFSLLVVPALDLLKTALYAGGRGAIAPPEPVDGTRRGQLRAGVGRGWRELVAFVRDAPGLLAVAAGTLVGGVLLGWALAAPLEGVVESSIRARLASHVAPVAAVEFFGNNWSVALTIAFSGLFAAIPAIVQLAFNGLVIGALSRTEVDPLELLAFIAPHGVFELPAIAVAGAVGLFLGRAWWRTWRGAASRRELADALERAFWVLIGVGVLLAIAALIEGFVSPYYWRPFL